MGKGADPVSMGLTALTAAAGLEGQGKAQREAARQGKAQRELIARQTAAFDKAMAAFESAKASGVFSPEAQIRQLETDTAGYESRDAGGAASAWTRAGGSPNDTPFSRAQGLIKLNYRKFMDQMRTKLRTESAMNELNALNSINSGQLNPGIAAAGQNRALALSQVPDPSGFLGAVQPFLNTPSRSPGVQTNAPVPGVSSLGTGGYMNFKPPKILDLWPGQRKKLAATY